MTNNRLKKFSDDEIWVILEALRDCDFISANNKIYNIFKKLLNEFTDEHIAR